MARTGIPQPLENILGNYCNIEGYWTGWRADLEAYFVHYPQEAAEFKRQLAEAINTKTPDTDELNHLIGTDLKNGADVAYHLMEIWQEIYGDEDIPDLDPLGQNM
jgi:hypothetical protein